MDGRHRSRIHANDGEDYYAEVYVSEVPTIRIDGDGLSGNVEGELYTVNDIDRPIETCDQGSVTNQDANLTFIIKNNDGKGDSNVPKLSGDEGNLDKRRQMIFIQAYDSVKIDENYTNTYDIDLKIRSRQTLSLSEEPNTDEL